MEATSKYMARMHRQLVNDYLNAEGTEREACARVAVDIGDRLSAEGNFPEIRSMCSFDLPLSVEGSLIPVMFKDKWRKEDGWASHHVCYFSGFIYDPLLGIEPVPAEEYTQRMFGFNLPLRDELSFHNFKRLVGRRKSS